MTEPTKGFQSRIFWCAENAYGDGIKTNSTVLLISNQVQGVRLSHSKALGETRNIDSYDISEFITGCKTYGITIDYIPDRNQSSTNCLCCKSVIRNSQDMLDSMAFQLSIGRQQTTKSYCNLKGCKCRSTTFSVAEDGPVAISSDWSVKDVSVSTSATTTCTDTISTDPWNFVGGSFARGNLDSWGYIVGNVSITVDNGIAEGKDIGNTTILKAVEGARSAAGTVNVCLTDGGLSYWTECATNESTDNITFKFGGGSAPWIRVENAILSGLEVPLDSDTAIVMPSIPFTGKKVRFANPIYQELSETCTDTDSVTSEKNP